MPGKPLSLQCLDVLNKSRGLGHCADKAAGLALTRKLQAISGACKDIRVAVLSQNISVTFPHCSWGGSLAKENKSRG